MRAAWGPPEGPGWGESPAPEADVRLTRGRAGAAAPGVAVPVARRRGSRRRERGPRLRIAGPWLLLVVLAVQAALSLRLVRADTAFDDEAMSLWAGHLEWAHWLHGTSIPPFPKYFSGAPVIYPPLGALADSLGGLAAARVLSLLFMLGATALLWDDHWSAVWAAGCVVRCRVVRCPGPDAASGGVRDRRRPPRGRWSRWPRGAWSGPGTGGGEPGGWSQRAPHWRSPTPRHIRRFCSIWSCLHSRC